VASPWRVAAVTGASGFVGSHLVALLQRDGVHVRALSRRPLGRDVDGVPGDVRDPAAVGRLLDGADVAFHTAALVTPWVRRPAEQYEVNLGGTRLVIEAAERRGIPAVCTSSIVILDPPPPGYVRLLDGNHYVRSKRRAAQLARDARGRGCAASLVIPSGIVGPIDRRPTSLGEQIRRALGGRGAPLSFRGGLYMVDVRDVAEAHLRAALAPADEYVLPGEYWSLDRLYAYLDSLAGRRGRRVRVPRPMVLAGSLALAGWSRVSTGEAPLITPAWVHYFCAAESMAYPDHAPRLGLQPRPIADSLRDAATWFAAA
jgi:dihydroflavonol-4-reductase